jgi:PadR family transcriptional regulator, regulatory protein PadR
MPLTCQLPRSTMYMYYVLRGSMPVSDTADRGWVSQLRKGLVELLVLAALKREEVYGYQLLQKLAALDGLALTESTLYPVLGRLADDRLVAVRQVPSPAGPPRRYYHLTAAGERRLGEMLAHWRRVNASVDALAGGAGAVGENSKHLSQGDGV